MNDNFAAVLPKTVEDIDIYKHVLFEFMDMNSSLPTEQLRAEARARMGMNLVKLRTVLNNLDLVEHEFKMYCEPLPPLVTGIYEAIKAASIKAFEEEDVAALRALFPRDFVTEVSHWMEMCANGRMLMDATKQTRSGAIVTVKLIEVLLFPLDPYDDEKHRANVERSKTISQNLSFTVTLTNELVQKAIKQGGKSEALRVDLAHRFRKFIKR